LEKKHRHGLGIIIHGNGEAYDCEWEYDKIVDEQEFTDSSNNLEHSEAYFEVAASLMIEEREKYEGD
jgi:hypothetical protein